MLSANLSYPYFWGEPMAKYFTGFFCMYTTCDLFKMPWSQWWCIKVKRFINKFWNTVSHAFIFTFVQTRNKKWSLKVKWIILDLLMKKPFHWFKMKIMIITLQQARLEILSQNWKDLQAQVARFKQTLEKVLDKNMPLPERIHILIREQIVTIISTLSALLAGIATIVLSVIGFFIY